MKTGLGANECWQFGIKRCLYRVSRRIEPVREENVDKLETHG